MKAKHNWKINYRDIKWTKTSYFIDVFPFLPKYQVFQPVVSNNTKEKNTG